MAFHWKDNWWFDRLQDGTVMIVHYGKPGDMPNGVMPDFSLAIPDGDWASIIASVSHTGETSGRWSEALEFHNGEKF
jgi:hypothetical protein